MMKCVIREVDNEDFFKKGFYIEVNDINMKISGSSVIEL